MGCTLGWNVTCQYLLLLFFIYLGFVIACKSCHSDSEKKALNFHWSIATSNFYLVDVLYLASLKVLKHYRKCFQYFQGVITFQ